MEIPAFSISQWGYGEGAIETTLYITSLPLSYLVQGAAIDRWTKDNRDGYQRPPLESRLRPMKGSVVRYILDEVGVFPTSVLVNVRKAVRFAEEKKISSKISLGKLMLPDKEKLWIIDGQHRIEALKRAASQKPELEEYPVPVSILSLEERFEEMLLFYIVNSRQKRIPTVIAYRHLQSMIEMVRIKERYKWIKEAILGSVQERQAVAAVIVDYLAENKDSPFCGHIQYLGEESEPKHLVEDSVLIRYISKLLGELTFHPMSPEEMADLLVAYWSAVKGLYPSCFSEDEKDNYTLLKHTGIASFTYLFPIVYGACARDADISEGSFKKYLSYLQEDVDSKELDIDFRRPIDQTWWSRAHGAAIARTAGENVFRIIRDNLAKKIQLVAKAKEESRK